MTKASPRMGSPCAIPPALPPITPYEEQGARDALPALDENCRHLPERIVVCRLRSSRGGAPSVQPVAEAGGDRLGSGRRREGCDEPAVVYLAPREAGAELYDSMDKTRGFQRCGDGRRVCLEHLHPSCAVCSRRLFLAVSLHHERRHTVDLECGAQGRGGVSRCPRARSSASESPASILAFSCGRRIFPGCERWPKESSPRPSSGCVPKPIGFSRQVPRLSRNTWAPPATRITPKR